MKLLRIISLSICSLLLSSQVSLANSVSKTDWLQEPNATESTTVRVGNLIYISGQASGDVTQSDNTGAALEKSLQKIKSIANKMGGDMSDIIKLDIYLVNFDLDFPLFDKIFPKYFSDHYPTRTAVGVSKLSNNHTVAINAIMVMKK